MYATSPYATQAKRNYVKNTIRQIQVDAARGEGEYLRTLAFMTGCKNHEVVKFNKGIQANYQKIFQPDQTVEVVLNNIEQLNICRPNI